MGNKVLLLNKSQKALAEALVMKLVLEGKVEVRNEVEHKVAEILVAAGQARVLRKREWGHIALLGNVEGE